MTSTSQSASDSDACVLYHPHERVEIVDRYMKEEFDRSEVEQFGTAMILFTCINILILGVFSTIYISLILVVIKGQCSDSTDAHH